MNKLNIDTKDLDKHKKTSRLAVASTVCAVLALGCINLRIKSTSHIFALIAAGLFLISFILAIAALIVIVRNKGLKGYFYTIVPLIFGALFVLLMIQVQVTKRTRLYYEKTNTAKYNFKLLYEAIVKYAGNHNGYLPAAEQWCDLLIKYDKSLTRENFKHPKVQGAAIAFNKNLSRLYLSDVHNDFVLFFVAYGDWNLTGTEELFLGRHENIKNETTDGEVGSKTLFSDVILISGEIKQYWYDKDGYRNYSEDDFKPLKWRP
jgi:hypothetical protein